jgi:hypothetical protein
MNVSSFFIVDPFFISAGKGAVPVLANKRPAPLPVEEKAFYDYNSLVILM